MKNWRSAAALACLWLLTGVSASRAADDVTLLRVFMRDGSALTSYGEFARVDDRVVFSIPTSAASSPALQLVNIAADRVDWDRTNRYADAARAARYAATRGEDDYVVLSNTVSRALNEATFAPDAPRRLAIAENARKMLVEWPPSHFNYRAAEVRQLLTMLDEAIADIRTSSGGSRFDLSLVAVAEPPAAEPLRPPPTPIESIDELLAAARLSESSDDRRSLLGVALTGLDRDGAALPRPWVETTRVAVRAMIETDARVDRVYDTMIRRAMSEAATRARAADVRGIRQVIESLRGGDAALGRLRTEAMTNAIAEVEAQLGAARSLQLARDRWALRAPLLRAYGSAMNEPLGIVGRLRQPLEDIKELAGSTQAALALVQRQVQRVRKLIDTIVPPDEGRSAHALLLSAAYLAESAVSIRREATLAGDIARAWDASSAAAGALMLSAKARMEIQSLLRPPQLQ